MAQDGVYVYDEGDLRKYRTEIPNLVDDMNLSPHAYRLYGHLKRVAGASEGSCWQNTETLAQICNMATGMVSKAKAELVKAGLIVIGKRRVGKNDVDNIRIIDIWARNFEAYGPKNATPSQKQGTPSQYERVPSITPSQYETKKEPSQEGTNKEKTSHAEKSHNDFSRAPAERAQQPALLPIEVLEPLPNTPPVDTRKPRQEQGQTNSNTQPILKAYLDCLGYKPANTGKEAKAAKAIAAAGYTPEQVTTAYKLVKQQTFWQNKHLCLASVHENIGPLLPQITVILQGSPVTGYRHTEQGVFLNI